MANKRLQATITIGGAVASSLRGAFGSVRGQIGQVGAALRRLETEQRTVTNAIQTFGRMGRNVDGLRQRYSALTAQVDRLRAAHQQLQRVENAQQANASRRADLRGQMFDAVAMGAVAFSPIKAAADFETAMLGVAKQVENARDENGKLTKTYYDMQRSIQELGREIPLATNDLAEMVAAGARMGVANKDLIQFTRTAAMMADAFELPAGELAENMGKISTMYKIPITSITGLADAINYLDDNAISKGGDIVNVLTRVGGVASSVKVTGAEMAALGSTLLSMGEQSETASTAINAVFSKFAAADKGTKKFKEAVKEIGMSTAEIQKGMQTDAIGTLMRIMEQIGKLKPEDQLGVMVELVGLEHSDTLAKLANNTAEWRRQNDLATKDQARIGSMQREFEARLQTTNAQLTMAGNRVKEFAVNLGTALLPSLNNSLSAFAPVVETFSNFARENPRVTQAVVGTVVALTSLRLATLASSYAFTFFKGGVLQVRGSVAKMRAGFALASAQLPVMAAGIRALGVAFVSTGIGALVAGLALGGVMIYRHWSGVKAFMAGTLEGIRAGVQPVVQTFTALWQSLEPLHPAFNAVAGAVRSAWEWFTNLQQPVTYSAGELGKAGQAGRTFGEMLGAGINIVLTPLQLLIQGITWVNNNIGAALDKAIAFKNAAGGAIGGAWQTAKGWIGLGDSQSETAPQPASAAALPRPAMANKSGGAGATYTDQSTTTIQVTQQPGEDPRQLARRIAEEQERQRQIRQRGAMYDGAATQ